MQSAAVQNYQEKKKKKKDAMTLIFLYSIIRLLFSIYNQFVIYK